MRVRERMERPAEPRRRLEKLHEAATMFTASGGQVAANVRETPSRQTCDAVLQEIFVPGVAGTGSPGPLARSARVSDSLRKVSQLGGSIDSPNPRIVPQSQQVATACSGNFQDSFGAFCRTGNDLSFPFFISD